MCELVLEGRMGGVEEGRSGGGEEERRGGGELMEYDRLIHVGIYRMYNYVG